MVSGFHGNVDSILAWLLLETLRAAVRDRPLACAVLLGLACQIKVIPLLVAPAFFFFWLRRGRGGRFFVGAAGTILSGWALPLVALPEVFLPQVLGYNSNWGSWGVTYALLATGWAPFQTVGFYGLSTVQMAVMTALKAVIVVSALALAWSRRRLSASDLAGTLAMTWTVFFVFAPGVGAQYLVWIAPFLLLAAPRCFALTTAAGAVFLFVFYTTISHGLPWYRGTSTAELLPQWVRWTLLPWAAFLLYPATRRHFIPR